VNTAIIWFRKTIRIHDNPLLIWAESSQEIDSIIPIYIIDEKLRLKEGNNVSVNRLNFLYDSLLDLNKNLKEKYGTELLIFSGDSSEVIESIINGIEQKVSSLLTDYCSEPKNRNEIDDIIINLNTRDINTKVFPGVSTILDIEKITRMKHFKAPKSTKDMNKIFEENLVISPSGHLIEGSLPCPNNINSEPLILESIIQNKEVSKFYISDEEIQKKNYQLRLETGFEKSYFLGGETEALRRLREKIIERPDFVNNFRKPSTYSTNDLENLMEPTTTGLSPYISNGCLSVRLVWDECANVRDENQHTKPPESLHGQLMFREMFYLLSRSVENWENDLDNSNCKPIRWGDYDEERIRAWEMGVTGFPYIDAMMRQLDATGWMHHLGRHAVSCFLTRGQLWQNWKYGRDIFERKLVDADWAVNNGNWLWLAGVAPFSMPYYRVYNPCPDSKSSLNVETEEASFIRYWVPELSLFPAKYIFEPHLAPLEIQKSSNCIIGEDYPLPVIDRKVSRKENIVKFKENIERIKQSTI
jgi:cryptochrome